MLYNNCHLFSFYKLVVRISSNTIIIFSKTVLVFLLLRILKDCWACGCLCINHKNCFSTALAIDCIFRIIDFPVFN